MNQKERALLFRSLHKKGDPLILFNVWDAGSAKVLQEIGAKAIGTGSWSVAAAHGFGDGEKMSLDLAVANLKRVAENVGVPVTIDLEGGYDNPHESARKVIEAGAVGINFEDQVMSGDGLYSIEDQSKRIRDVREAAAQLDIPLFINARTDVFLKSRNDTEKLLEEAVSRGMSYAEFGADGLFVPGLIDLKLIERLCEVSLIPINIMMQADAPTPRQLAASGVARISYGPIPYLLAMEALKEAGRKALSMS